MGLQKRGVLIMSIISILLLSSCSLKKDVVYFQNNAEYQEKNIKFHEQTIQPNDILKIEIASLVSEAAIPYNKQAIPNSTSSSSEQMQGYVVDKNNKIKLPILGELLVEDMTLSELESIIKNMLVDGGHLENPTVSVVILNSKVTILGEVNKPGTFYINEPRMTLLQALGLAGDLTINGKRKDILLIREVNGKRKTYHIDLTNIDLIDKVYYQIQSNDVLVVSPNYSKVKSAGFLGSPSTIISISSLLITLTVLLTQ